MDRLSKVELINESKDKDCINVLDWIKTKKKYINLFSLLLNDFKIVKGSNSINDIILSDPDNINYVTIDGQFIGKNHVIKTSRIQKVVLLLVEKKQ